MKNIDLKKNKFIIFVLIKLTKQMQNYIKSAGQPNKLMHLR